MKKNLFDLEVKLTEEWEKWMGFTLKKGMVYGKIRGHYVVVTDPSYAWSNGCIETFILRDGDWEHECFDTSILLDGDWEHDYVAPEFFGGALVKVEGLFHDFLKFLDWVEWTTDVDEVCSIYEATTLPQVELDKLRNVYNCWTLEDAAEVRAMEEEEE